MGDAVAPTYENVQPSDSRFSYPKNAKRFVITSSRGCCICLDPSQVNSKNDPLLPLSKTMSAMFNELEKKLLGEIRNEKV